MQGAPGPLVVAAMLVVHDAIGRGPEHLPNHVGHEVEKQFRILRLEDGKRSRPVLHLVVAALDGTVEIDPDTFSWALR